MRREQRQLLPILEDGVEVRMEGYKSPEGQPPEIGWRVKKINKTKKLTGIVRHTERTRERDEFHRA